MTDRVLGICSGTSYEPLGLLGRGGMGQIYLVRHRLLDKTFALKVMHPHLADSPMLAERLRIEAQAMARLNHPNVAKVIDFWVGFDGTPSYVMELLTGNNLWVETSERQRISASDVIDWGCEALAALAAAHGIGVVHRDIKPENLLLHQAPGKTRTLKVLDFGVARVVGEVSALTPEPLSKPTRAGAKVGSPLFMSPEGRRGEPVDQRADIYSLGLTLYHALVGNIGFSPSRDMPPPSKAANMAILPELDAIIHRSVQYDADDRYQTAKDFLADLSRLAPVRRSRESWPVRR